mgnify:CR=1 FL=1
MATYRELINEVLIRLREDTIATDWSGNINDSSTVTDYQKVIGSLINDSKRNVEGYHDWLVLRETVDITTVSGTRNYNLNSGQEVKVIDAINQTTGYALSQVSRKYINSMMYPSENSGDPICYAFNGSDSSNNLKIDLEPKPNSVQTLSFDVSKPQANLTLATDVMKMPEKVVVLGAWARAVSERGEDGGTQSGVLAEEFKEALNQAILLDNSNVQYESDWVVR